MVHLMNKKRSSKASSNSQFFYINSNLGTTSGSGLGESSGKRDMKVIINGDYN